MKFPYFDFNNYESIGSTKKVLINRINIRSNNNDDILRGNASKILIAKKHLLSDTIHYLIHD